MRQDDRRKYNGKKPTWDVAEGKRLYDEEVPLYKIAQQLGVKYYKVWDYASRHWTPAAISGYVHNG